MTAAENKNDIISILLITNRINYCNFKTKYMQSYKNDYFFKNGKATFI